MMVPGFHRWAWPGVWLLLIFCSAPVHAATILIMHSYSQEYNWTKRQNTRFVEHLESSVPEDVLISTEYLDAKRNTYNDLYAQEIYRHLKVKYAHYRPDLIYVTDDAALGFARHYLVKLFPGVPIVFSGINNFSVLNEIDSGLITGVFEKKEIAPNLAIIEGIDLKHEKLVFVGDASATYQAIEHEIKTELTNYPDISAEFISTDHIEDVITALNNCHCKYVFLTTIGAIKERSGQSLSLRSIVERIVKSGDFALLSMEDGYLYDGVLGGYVTSGEAQGEVAAEFAAKILRGVPVIDLPAEIRSPNKYIFNQRELKRLGLVLPAAIRTSTVFLNSDISLYQAYRSVIISMIIALSILLILVLISAVVMLTNRRNKLKTIAEALTRQKDMLLQAQTSLEVAQQIARLGSWTLDVKTGDLVWSDEVYRIFEVDKTRFNASYEAFLAAIHPDDRELVGKVYNDSVKNHTSYEIEHRLLMPDGRIKYVIEHGFTKYNINNEPVDSYGTVQDITQKKQDEKRLRQWASIFENTIEAVLITDAEQIIIDVNRAYTDITGYSKQEALGNRPSFRRSERHDAAFYHAMWQSIETTGSWNGEIWNRTKAGELSPEWHSISTILDESGKVSNYIGVFTDISVLKRSEEKLEHLANHDPLTGLPNRSLLSDRLDQSIRRLEREPGKLSVLYLDLDRFKKVNDTLGHPVGDALLQEAAARLKLAIRGCDTVGRLGGDEFLVLIEHYETINDIKTVVEKLRDVIEKPFFINDNKLYISVSAGISVYPDDGMDSATLIRNADSALYRAKETGRNNYSFYDTEITKQAANRLEIENDLRHALDNHEFNLHYQPKIDLQDGNVIGAEALIRLQRRDKKILPPDAFIPVAEESGLIIPIGKWVLEEAVRQLAEWSASGHALKIAINISAIQIQRGEIIQTLVALQKKYKFNPADIELEVTESVLIEFPEKAVEVLTAVRKLGLSVALDDFGTGFSSLSNLKRYPINTIKIDKSFVQDILVDVNDAAITRAVIAMGRSLDMTVVAEGVETASHVRYLQELGCHQAQGYYYSRPVPAEEFTKQFLS